MQSEMIQPRYKTLAEHREYLHEITKLMLFYLHLYLDTHPEENFRTVMRERIDIYRKTDANPGPKNPSELYFDEPPWKTMEDKAYELYLKYRTDRAAFEREAFEVFRASLDARCERDYADRSTLGFYQCGSLRHERAVQKNGTMFFHIANAVEPRSIFDDPEYLRGCFNDLMTISEKIYGATRIASHTWLNSLPKWLSYFPQEWKDNLEPPATDVHWSYDFWGQFISARGTFNWKYGEILRSTGQFPFLPRTGSCSIESMRRFLNPA